MEWKAVLGSSLGMTVLKPRGDGSLCEMHGAIGATHHIKFTIYIRRHIAAVVCFTWYKPNESDSTQTEYNFKMGYLSSRKIIVCVCVCVCWAKINELFEREILTASQIKWNYKLCFNIRLEAFTCWIQIAWKSSSLSCCVSVSVFFVCLSKYHLYFILQILE